MLASAKHIYLFALMLTSCVLTCGVTAAPAPDTDNSSAMATKKAFVDLNTQARFLAYSDYHNELIATALEHGNSALGSFTAVPTNVNIPPLRVMQEAVSAEIINMFWGPALPEFESPDLFTIEVPLLNGISGCRILMIRNGEQPTFDGLESLNELTFGLGHGWADARIFKHNKLNVQTSMDTESLFLTLSAGRYDGVPFGADRVFKDLEDSKKLTKNLTLEKDILIYYPMPVLYFVNSKFPALANALERGLKKMQTNGKMKALFIKHHSQVYRELKEHKRKIFKLENPVIRANAPVIQSPCRFEI